MIDYAYNAGMALADNFAEAIILAKLNNEPVQLSYDGQEFEVRSDSTVPGLLQQYMTFKNVRKPYADT